MGLRIAAATLTSHLALGQLEPDLLVKRILHTHRTASTSALENTAAAADLSHRALLGYCCVESFKANTNTKHVWSFRGSTEHLTKLGLASALFLSMQGTGSIGLASTSGSAGAAGLAGLGGTVALICCVPLPLELVSVAAT